MVMLACLAITAIVLMFVVSSLPLNRVRTFSAQLGAGWKVDATFAPVPITRGGGKANAKGGGRASAKGASPVAQR
jgi:hypothetical protein